MSVVDIASETGFSELLAQSKSTGGSLVLFFTANWHDPCKQMTSVVEELAKDNQQLKFVRIEAEDYPDVSGEYGVESVPTFVVVKGGKKVDTLEGASAPKLVSLIQKSAKSASQSAAPSVASKQPAASAEDLNIRLGKLVKAAQVMVFIKGSPDAPRCGFSKTLCALLKEEDIRFGFFDILSDEEVRQGLKTYSNWKTYPQVYVKGELIGGLDVITELKEEGQLEEMFPKPSSPESLNDRLKALVNKEPVMLFMKGDPSAPQCGFSNKMVSLLTEAGFSTFGHFDILTDDEVRQGLKAYSNWPTYPQLYVKGELQGGLDVCQEMAEGGDLQELAASLA